jgi:hypothetical protein
VYRISVPTETAEELFDAALKVLGGERWIDKSQRKEFASTWSGVFPRFWIVNAKNFLRWNWARLKATDLLLVTGQQKQEMNKSTRSGEPTPSSNDI